MLFIFTVIICKNDDGDGDNECLMKRKHPRLTLYFQIRIRKKSYKQDEDCNPFVPSVGGSIYVVALCVHDDMLPLEV